MKNPLRRSTPTETAAAEIARLQARQATAERQRAETLAALNEAEDLRRAALAGDDDGLLVEITAKVRRLRSDAIDAAAVLDDIAAVLATAEEKHRQALDTEARVDAARRLDAIGESLRRPMADITKAAETFSQAVKAALAVVPADLALAPGHYAGRPDGRDSRDAMTANELVCAYAVECLFGAVPALFDLSRDSSGYRHQATRLAAADQPQPAYPSPQPVPALAPADAARIMIFDRIENRKAAIIDGTASADLSDVATRSDPKLAPAEPADVVIFALESFTYENQAGREIVVVGQWTTSIPAAAARAAIAAEIAIPMDTAEGRAAFEAEKARRAAQPMSGGQGAVSPSRCRVRLGNVFSAYPEAAE